MTIPANAKQCLACGSVIPEECSLCPMCPDPRIAKLESELAQARAEIERLKAPLPKNPLCQGDGNCPGVCGGCLELTTNREYRLAIALRDARSERDFLRARLEQMRRPVTDEEWRQYVPQGSRARIAIDALLAARARRQEKLEKETQCN